MKTHAILTLAVAVLFSYDCFAQSGESLVALQTKKKPTSIYEVYQKSSPDSIIGYSVKEKINMKFGASTKTYSVSDASLIQTNELGPQNTRVITPIFGNPKTKVVETLPTVPLY